MKKLSVNIGNVCIGGGSPIVIQTMCNCDTNDIEKALSQCRAMSLSGASLIRLTTQGIREVESLSEIKRVLRSEGIETPLVADVHFSSEVALAASKVADKVRINPGNFAKEHSVAMSQFRKLIALCKEYGTAIRIGVNHGSLGERITELYGNTPQGMVEAIKEWVEICIEEEFYSVVLSLKASNTVAMIEVYRKLYEWMQERGVIFPLHLGVTEAGNGDMGRIKSSVGIGTLLSEGIGDTIRVSLTENPLNELPVARIIADIYDNKKLKKRSDNHFDYNCNGWEEFILTASCEIGAQLIKREIDDFTITYSSSGEKVEKERLESFKLDLLQASRRLFSKCEYVACPGCGRTLYNIEEVFEEVKKRTSHLKGLSIAVMGCIVNGPGEMADADYGYVGEGRGKVSIYRGKEALLRGVPEEKAIDALLKIIEQDQTFSQ